MIQVKNGSIRLEGSAGKLPAEMTIIIGTLRYEVLPQNGFSDDEAEKLVRDSLDMGMTAPDEVPDKILGNLADMLKDLFGKKNKEDE